MKKQIIENGLLLTDMELTFNSQSLHLQRVSVDPSSGGTVVSIDLAGTIGIVAEENDVKYRISGVGETEFVYSKIVDSVRLGYMQTKDFTLEIGPMNYGFRICKGLGFK